MYGEGGKDPLAGASSLYGEGGKDPLAGASSLYGEQGKDPLAGASSLYGEGGKDPLAGASSLYGEQGKDPLAGASSLYGEEGRDPLAGASSLYGEQGKDPLAGASSLYGEEGKDPLAGASSLYGEEGKDPLAGASSLYGEGGKDPLAGASSLYGEGGRDPLAGASSLYGDANIDWLWKAEDWWSRVLASKTRIGIFTSGTTQQPRLIYHSLATLLRSVRRSERHAQDVWGLCYDPAKFAGLQVVFQAVCNQNPIVRLFGLDTQAVATAIEDFGITHLSATPTFLRLLAGNKQQFNSVRRVTVGGEILGEGLLRQLESTFPNAKIRNVYASTEVGSLLESFGQAFRIPEQLAGQVKVINSELWVHRSLLAESLQEHLSGTRECSKPPQPSSSVSPRPKENGTCESGTDSPACPAQEDANTGFYRTGDCVEVITEHPLEFRFVARRTDFINVGGYKVNPHKVEQALISIEHIISTRVYGQPNSVTGQLVCCDIVLARSAEEKRMAIDAKFIREQLGGQLQSYELPRIVNVVSKIEMTESGKKTRKPN